MVNRPIAIASIILIFSLTACGNENKSMYEVKEQPKVETKKQVAVGYGEIEATISDGADKDKNLAKKQLVMINGQPIAALVDEYTNESGYKVNAKDDTVVDNIENIDETLDDAVISAVTDTMGDAIETLNNPLSIDGKTLLALIKPSYSNMAIRVQGILEKNGLYTLNMDMNSLEEMAETNSDMIMSNEYDLSSMLMAFNDTGDLSVSFIEFRDSTSLFAEVDLEEQGIKDKEITVLEYEDTKEICYVNTDEKWVISAVVTDDTINKAYEIFEDLGIK